MKDPVRGIFRVTGFYDAHPSSSPPGTRITGVIVADGLPATPAEHKVSGREHWADSKELPVLVDRTDPSRFVILWDEVKPVSWQDRERQAAQAEADRLNAITSQVTGDLPADAGAFGGFGGAGAPGTGSPFDFNATAEVAFDDVMTVGPDGQVHKTTLPPEAAAGVEAAVRQALEGLGPMLAGEASGTPYGGVNPVEAARMVASRSGERATAIVVAVEDKKPRRAALTPPGGMADVTLEVTRADGSIYTTHTVIGFSTPERRAIVAVVGKRLNVFIDPTSPSKLAIDTAGLF
jgi:hypothetical protein